MTIARARVRVKHPRQTLERRLARAGLSVLKRRRHERTKLSRVGSWKSKCLGKSDKAKDELERGRENELGPKQKIRARLH